MPVSVVTGATGGIGRYIALGLAQAGHTVVIVARDRGRGEALLGWLAAEIPAVTADLLLADLSSLAATAEVAALIAARYPALDVLVNNAGMFTTARSETPEGHERVLATNHLSPFVLTRALLPCLLAAAKGSGSARIVNVGSSTSDRATIAPADLEGQRRWGMVRAYSQSKLALMMATFGWARQLQGTGVVANVVHPGAVATGLVRAGGVVGLAWRIMAPLLLTQERGADTPLHVCLDPLYGSVTGAYVKRRRPVRPNPRALDPALAQAVWDATVRLVGRGPP